MKTTHVRDRIIQYDQKRTTAICGARIKAAKTIYVGQIIAGSAQNYDFLCVGCRAIIAEREKEAASHA